MHKIPPAIEKIIDKHAASLPTQMYVFSDSVIMTGAELKLSPYAETQKGKELIDERLYVVPMPGYRDVNHRRRMRHAYQQGGIDAVLEYIDQFIDHGKLVEENVGTTKKSFFQRLKNRA